MFGSRDTPAEVFWSGWPARFGGSNSQTQAGRVRDLATGRWNLISSSPGAPGRVVNGEQAPQRLAVPTMGTYTRWPDRVCRKSKQGCGAV